MIKLHINKKDKDNNPYTEIFELDTNVTFGDSFKLTSDGYMFKSYPLTNVVSEDSIVEAVRQDLLERSQTGIRKYNTTLDRTDLTLKDWLQHQYEELLDAALYCKKALETLDK